MWGWARFENHGEKLYARDGQTEREKREMALDVTSRLMLENDSICKGGGRREARQGTVKFDYSNQQDVEVEEEEDRQRPRSP